MHLFRGPFLPFPLLLCFLHGGDGSTRGVRQLHLFVVHWPFVPVVAFLVPFDRQLDGQFVAQNVRSLESARDFLGRLVRAGHVSICVWDPIDVVLSPSHLGEKGCPLAKQDTKADIVGEWWQIAHSNMRHVSQCTEMQRKYLR